MRKLASIQVIKNIEIIDGADLIEKATILGWEVVVKKGDFKIGDLVVYVEIDSIMPGRPEFEFLRPRKFKIKTVKLKNTISQGIAFPLEILKMANPDFDLSSISEDLDVTELLGIKKWDPEQESIVIEKEPEFNDKNRIVRLYKKYKYLTTKRIKILLGMPVGTASSDFPSYIPKTDETRCQNSIRGLETHQGKFAYVTEKLEGCLEANTIIETKDGLKTIKEIVDTKYSGKVKSYNIEKEKVEWKKVIGHSVEKNVNNWYEIETFSGKKLIVTGNHGIYIPELKCYRRVDEFKGNEKVLIN